MDYISVDCMLLMPRILAILTSSLIVGQPTTAAITNKAIIAPINLLPFNLLSIYRNFILNLQLHK